MERIFGLSHDSRGVCYESFVRWEDKTIWFGVGDLGIKFDVFDSGHAEQEADVRTIPIDIILELRFIHFELFERLG